MTFSKRRYTELEEALKGRWTDEDVEAFMGVVREVMRFDPGLSSYTKARAEASRAWRSRKAEEARERGVPAYELTGAKGSRTAAKERRALASGSQAVTSSNAPA